MAPEIFLPTLQRAAKEASQSALKGDDTALLWPSRGTDYLPQESLFPEIRGRSVLTFLKVPEHGISFISYRSLHSSPVLNVSSVSPGILFPTAFVHPVSPHFPPTLQVRILTLQRLNPDA